MSKDPYHHGELRAALLDAAERALNEDPTRDVSIRSLAAELGVSATAPHAHFKTKSDLMAAVATRGFDKLQSATLAYGARATSARTMIEALAEAYIRFSAENPGLYKLMFTTGVTLEDHPELFAASRASYAVLQNAIQDIFAGITVEERDQRALVAWGIVHGLSALRSEDRIPEDIIDDRSPEALARLTAITVLSAGDDGVEDTR